MELKEAQAGVAFSITPSMQLLLDRIDDSKPKKPNEIPQPGKNPESVPSEEPEPEIWPRKEPEIQPGKEPLTAPPITPPEVPEPPQTINSQLQSS
jgi:hypothetical protein